MNNFFLTRVGGGYNVTIQHYPTLDAQSRGHVRGRTHTQTHTHETEERGSQARPVLHRQLSKVELHTIHAWLKQTKREQRKLLQSQF